MDGPVLKIKTGFRGFETERNKSGISKVYRDMIKSFMRAYMSYISIGNIHSQDVLKFVNFIYHEYETKM